jgi:hypothetical protein
MNIFSPVILKNFITQPGTGMKGPKVHVEYWAILKVLLSVWVLSQRGRSLENRKTTFFKKSKTFSRTSWPETVKFNIYYNVTTWKRWKHYCYYPVVVTSFSSFEVEIVDNLSPFMLSERVVNWLSTKLPLLDTSIGTVDANAAIVMNVLACGTTNSWTSPLYRYEFILKNKWHFYWSL